MMQLRPILDSDQIIGARRLVVGADRVGRVAIWTGAAWAFAADPEIEIQDAVAIGGIVLGE